MGDGAEGGGCGQSRVSLVLTHVVVVFDDVWQSPATGSEGIADLASTCQPRVLELDIIKHDTKHVHHRSAPHPYWTEKSHQRRGTQAKVVFKWFLYERSVAQGQRSRLQRHGTSQARPIQSHYCMCILAL